MKRIVCFAVLIFYQVCGVPQQKWRESDDGSKFYIETETKYNWFQAWSECARKNMSLIAIDTLAKHEQIDNLLKRLYAPGNCPPIWISGNNLGSPARFEWASTGKSLTFTNWAPGQPADAQKDEHCFLVWIDFQWHDGHCTIHNNGFICEENQLVKKNSKNFGLFDLKEMDKHQNIVFYFKNSN